MAKKAEAQKLLEEEMKTLKCKPDKVDKISKFEIEKLKEKEDAEKAAAAAAAAAAKKNVVAVEPVLIENLNRLEVEGDVARNVDEAISILRYFWFVFKLFFNLRLKIISFLVLEMNQQWTCIQKSV